MRKLLSYYRPMRIYDYINTWSGIQVKGGRSTCCVFDTILCVDTRYIGLLLVRQRPAAEHARSKVYDLLTTSPMASIRSDSRRTHWRNSRESLGFASDSLVIHGNFRSWFARGSLAYDAWKELVTRAVLYFKYVLYFLCGVPCSCCVRRKLFMDRSPLLGQRLRCRGTGPGRAMEIRASQVLSCRLGYLRRCSG